MIHTDFDSGMLSYLGDAVWELLVREHISAMFIFEVTLGKTVTTEYIF